MRLPSMPQSGKSVPDNIKEIINYLRAITITGGRGVLVKQSPNGTTIEITTKGGGKGTTTEAAPINCPFGETYEDGADTKIRGGVVYCGDKNYNVAGQTLALGTDGDWLVSIKLDGIEPNMDDDGEVFLPGVKTSTGTPAWDNKANTEGTTEYDDNTNPTLTVDGSIVVPLGRLVIADDAATFTPVGCGHITVTQCAGVLSHSRG